MTSGANALENVTVDSKNLYREENITDLQVASIRKLIPINIDGTDDTTRKNVFIGQTHVMTQAGAVPINCPLEADTLEAAVKEFPQAASKALEKMMEEVKEMQRQQASRIVVPTAAPPAGKIQLN